MSFGFEVDPGIGSENGFQDEDFLSDYEGLFDEEEFRSLGVNPSGPTPAKPGSEDKVVMLAARYAAGLPLWHEEDCYDHGPGDSDSEFDDEDD
jgi:hypothetical protein